MCCDLLKELIRRLNIKYASQSSYFNSTDFNYIPGPPNEMNNPITGNCNYKEGAAMRCWTNVSALHGGLIWCGKLKLHMAQKSDHGCSRPDDFTTRAWLCLVPQSTDATAALLFIFQQRSCSAVDLRNTQPNWLTDINTSVTRSTRTTRTFTDFVDCFLMLCFWSFK